MTAKKKGQPAGLTSISRDESGELTLDHNVKEECFGAASIVALGEATHGTHEFFTLRHLFTRHLISDHGYRRILFEADYSEIVKLNNYLVTGEGNLMRLIMNLKYWMYRTSEFHDTLRWIREFNKTGGVDSPVCAIGLDMQLVDGSFEFLENLANGEHGAIHSAMRRAHHLIGRFDKLQPALQRRFLHLLDGAELILCEMSAIFSAFRETAVAPTQLEELNEAVRQIQLIIWSIALRRSPDPRSRVLLRDFLMAENAKRLIRESPIVAKTVIWAHNFHVAKYPRRMGDFLAQEFGGKYFPVCLSFHDGMFNINDGESIRPVRAELPADADPESIFHNLGHDFFFLNLSTLRTEGSPLHAYLGEVRRLHDIGAGRGSTDFQNLPIADVFDAVAFANHTTQSQIIGQIVA